MKFSWPGTHCLQPALLLLAIPPLLVVIGGDLLLQGFTPAPIAIKLEGTNFVHGDATARLSLMTSFLLVIGATVAAFAYFVRLLLKVDGGAAGGAIGGFLLMVAIGAIFYDRWSQYEMQEKLSNQVHCAAASLAAAAGQPEPAGVATPATGSAPNPAETRIYPAQSPRDAAGDVLPACVTARHQWLRDKTDVESAFLGAGVPALVFGAILCLSLLPAATSDPATRVELVRRQIRRLNTILYLSAFLLVAGILFARAYYTYPTFALSDAQAGPFLAHAEALITYHAVNHSLLIAAFYLPAASILAARAEEGAADPAVGEARAELMAPMQLVKAAFAIFAPLLAGFLPEMVKLF